nr:MAG TPA: hypothetical protein [Caudoviricetes sp.]
MGLVDFIELQTTKKWWSWRELNPRPKFLHTNNISLKSKYSIIYQCIMFMWC